MVILVSCPSALSDIPTSVASIPIFSLTPSNSFTSAQTLEITNPTSGTNARYEFATTDTNGDGDIDLDDVSDPTSASTAYTAPLNILVNAGDVYCIKVMAHDAGGTYLNSSVASACYRRKLFDLTFNPAPAGNFTSAQTLTITGLVVGTVARYESATTDINGDGDIDPDDVSTPTPASTAYTAPLNILPNGGDAYCIKVIALHPDGTYVDSTVASACYRRGLSEPTFSLTPSNSFTSAQTLTITSATTGTTARYEFATADTNGDGDINLLDVSDPTSTSTAYTTPLNILPDEGDVYCIKAIAAGGTYANSPVTSACYGRLNAASTPTFNPAPAGNFTSAQTLTITSPTTGTTARYEAATSDTNGDGDIDPDDVSTPTSTSTAYTTPLNILPNEGDVYCIKVIAHDAGGTYANSPVASGCYRRTIPVPGITSGGASTSVTVTMSHSLTGVTIYYRAASDTTTDLSVFIDPTDTSTYTGTGTTASPATFTSPGHVYRIKAVAVATDGRVSPETAIQRFDYDIDSDDDGLIDIRNLEMLGNIRFNLAGTTYDDEALDTGTGDPGITFGGPTTATTACQTDPDGDTFFLCGYELMGNLDFTLATSYASGTVNATWCPDASNNCVNTTGTGFPGIGAATGTTGGFTGIFHGNDNSISNFYSRNTANTNAANIGLFNLNEGGTIRNLTVEANVFGGTATDRIGGLVGYNNSGSITESSTTGNSVDGGAGDDDQVGGLVGYNNGGVITASYATGDADGGDGEFDHVGGLVGYNNGGSITASYATGDADGGDGEFDDVGGLVGLNDGTITASYATGSADGGTGDIDHVGGLVGDNRDTITASYATGDVDGGDGRDGVGGLVGYNAGSTITASYATGDADGGDGDRDRVGGLVGSSDGSSTITASYATGDADGGDGDEDRVGGLVGDNGSTITASYSFGTATGETAGDNGTAYPAGVSAARNLTLFRAGSSSWNNATNNTRGAWNFGTASQNPALVYNDYDGAGTTYASCSSDNGGYPTTIPGTTTTLTCGTTLVGGNSNQRR